MPPLMRWGVVIQPAPGVRDPDLLEKLTCPGVGGAPGQAKVHFQGLGELAPDAEDGVEGGHGFLEDHSDVPAAAASHTVLAELEEVFAFEQHLAVDYLARRLGDEAHEGEGADGLAAPALADEAHGLPGLQRIGDAVDGLDHAVLGVEIGLEVLDLQKGRHGLYDGPRVEGA